MTTPVENQNKFKFFEQGAEIPDLIVGTIEVGLLTLLAINPSQFDQVIKNLVSFW